MNNVNKKFFFLKCCTLHSLFLVRFSKQRGEKLKSKLFSCAAHCVSLRLPLHPLQYHQRSVKSVGMWQIWRENRWHLVIQIVWGETLLRLLLALLSGFGKSVMEDFNQSELFFERGRSRQMCVRSPLETDGNNGGKICSKGCYSSISLATTAYV